MVGVGRRVTTMPFPLPENLKPGMALRDLVTVETMRTINAILNSLTVEVREGTDYPYIEKTARPGEQQPWVIVLPAAAATTTTTMSDADPAAPEVEAYPGESEDASRADHVHPRPADPASPTELGQNSEGSADDAVATAYDATASAAPGLSVWVCTRIRYNHAAATPKLYAYMSKLTFPAGFAPTVSGQTRVEVDAPTKVTWSTS